jgi:hypothetical protein
LHPANHQSRQKAYNTDDNKQFRQGESGSSIGEKKYAHIS